MADDSPRLQRGDLLFVGAALGLASGFAEGAVRLARQSTGGPALHLGAYVAWMPAAANLVLLLLVAVALVPVTRLLSARLGTPLAIGALWWLACWNVAALYTPPVHPAAIALIAAGAAVQLARQSLRRWHGLLRLVRLGAPVLLAALVLIAGGIEGWRAFRERQALSAQPAADASRPNIVLLVLDTVRSFNLSVYGYFRSTTPELEQLARRGVVFDGAIATAPWTLPSHASMFTGRWLHEQSTGWKDPLDATFPTLPGALSAQGYATGGFIANLGFCDREFGLARGFGHYEDYPLTWRTVMHSSRIGKRLTENRMVIRLFGDPSTWTRKTAASVTDSFLRWSNAQGDRPYFAFLNYFDAHWRRYSSPPFQRLFKNDSSLAPPTPLHPRGMPKGFGTRAEFVQEYDRSIAYIDGELGRLFRELERRGTLDHTLIIVVGDHGEEFLEHANIGHGNGLYHTSLAVPLMMALPGKVPAGQRVQQFVSIRDLPATILEVSGGDPGIFPGTTLSDSWQPSPTRAMVRDPILAEVNHVWNRPLWYPASKGNMKSLYADSLHLVFNGDSSYELYSLTGDPWEQQNLAQDPAAAEALARLRTVLDGVPLAPPSSHAPREQDADP